MKITEIFDDDTADADNSPSTKPNTSTSTNNKPPPPSRSRCSSRIRRRNGTMLLGRHRSANSSLKCYEKDCCSSDEKKTPKNGKKRQSSNSIKQSNGKKHKMDLTNLDDDNMSNGTNETNLTVSAKSSTKANNNAAKGTSGTKQLQNRRSNAMGEGTSKGTKNDLGLAIIPLVENEDGKNGLINYIANLVEFKWNNSKRMDFIDKNFPNFRAANPELAIKLFGLMFLNICAEIGGNEEKKAECTKLMEMGKKVKELLAEVGENMEEAKFRKWSRETERALSLIFSNSIEELNDHPFRRNRRQLAETVKNALKAI